MKIDPGILFWFVVYFGIATLAVSVVAIYQLLKKQHQYDTFQKIVSALSIFLLPLIGGIAFLIFAYQHDKKMHTSKGNHRQKELSYQEENH